MARNRLYRRFIIIVKLLVCRYRCSCPPGTSGPRCESNVDECASSPCGRGGTCLDLVGGYQCQCAAGFTGRHCEADINECLSQPCSGSGAVGCVQLDAGAGHRCVCMDGWTGSRCETRMPLCPCLNGGWCPEPSASAICACPQVNKVNSVIPDTKKAWFHSYTIHNYINNQCTELSASTSCACPQVLSTSKA